MITFLLGTGMWYGDEIKTVFCSFFIVKNRHMSQERYASVRLQSTAFIAAQGVMRGEGTRGRSGKGREGGKGEGGEAEKG